MPARPCLFVACAPSGSRIHPPYVKLFRKNCPAESTRIVERPKNQGPEQLQRETAIGLLARAAKLAPQRAEVQKLLAIATSGFRDWEDSVAAWERYLTLEPNDDFARRERGLATVHTGQFDKGMADLEWFIARHPDDAMGRYEIGMAELDVDQEQALAQLDKSVALKPDFAEARSTRGSLYYQQGKPETALPDLEFAAARLPGDPVTLDRLGQTYVTLDRPADAVKVLRKAAELAPNDFTNPASLRPRAGRCGPDGRVRGGHGPLPATGPGQNHYRARRP